MARKRWLQFVTGTSFVLAIGCQTPNGPGTIRTLDGAGGPVPLATRFPAAPAPGSPTVKSTPPLPPPNMPPIDNSPMKIGPPAAQTGQVTTPALPKLRQYDPSTGYPVPPNDTLPSAIPVPVNTSRNASPAAFDDWNDPRTNPALYAPVAGQQGVPAQLPPPPTTSLPHMLPIGSAAPISQPNVTMPQAHMPSSPSMPMPTFPATPTFPSPTMPNTSVQPNVPAAPNLSTPGAARQTIYPGSNP